MAWITTHDYLFHIFNLYDICYGKKGDGGEGTEGKGRGEEACQATRGG